LGEDGEILEYTRPMFMVTLPPARIVTPREKPIPKEKPLTKWEKFRLERGLSARKKRSRLVFDPISNDWVPRWGHNSKKAVEEQHNWLMVDKPGNEGTDPFTKLKQEKRLVQEKENLKRMKNEVYA
jgi:regulator of ribosome biosynthesis